MKIIDLRSTTFYTRDELDGHVDAVLKHSNAPLSDFVIQGRKEDLDKLSLSTDKTVYGVKVVLIEDIKKDIIKKFKKK